MPRLVVVLGPTAAGKSAVGLALAERFGGEIVNADALQVYRGLDIGTAKPSAADRRRVRHHLLDILEPDEAFSAGEFARRARAAVAEMEARGHRAVVVGGSGLYLRALLDGLSPLPPVEPAVRAGLRRRLEREGLAALRAELSERDPATAARLAPGDRQRTLRALEVLESSGVALSSWTARPPAAAPLTALRIGLTLPRALLYDRISARVERMFESGWVDEVATLLARGFNPSQPAFQAIGYREVARIVAGDLSVAEARERIVVATRRFAKRQETWFRREPDVTWLAAEDLDRAVAGAVRLLEQKGPRDEHGEADD